VKYIIAIFVFITIHFFALAQFDFGLTAAQTKALGGTQTVQQHAFSAVENPAGLAELEAYTLGISAQNHYLLEGLNSFTLAAALPVKSSTFGVGLQYHGFDAYTEMKAGLAYGRKLLDNLTIGGEIHAYYLNIANYGSNAFVNFELGIQANLTKQLLIGAHLKNPIKINVTEDNQLPVPTTISAGLKYTASAKAQVMVEAEKIVNRDAIFKAGLHYRFNQTFALLMGINTEPAVFSTGISWQIQNFEVVVGSTYHTILGYSPVVGLNLLPNSNNDAQ